ncbi:hypothetical protein L209DRAFT_323626 [Thermothelomyces heterothallicus CBS 203.75]
MFGGPFSRLGCILQPGQVLAEPGCRDRRTRSECAVPAENLQVAAASGGDREPECGGGVQYEGWPLTGSGPKILRPARSSRSPTDGKSAASQLFPSCTEYISVHTVQNKVYRVTMGSTPCSFLGLTQGTWRGSVRSLHMA